MVCCHLSDAFNLWEKYKENFSEEIKFHIYRQVIDNNPTLDEVCNKCLIKVKDSILALGGKNLL